VIPAGEFLNINFPNRPDQRILLKPATLGTTNYLDERSAYNANGKRYHFWSGGLDHDSAEGDLAALLQGYTTLTLVQVMPAEGRILDAEAFQVPVAAESPKSK
jgi:broad specificity polyphosphatase/5'/3'-nucleotidase SurE